MRRIRALGFGLILALPWLGPAASGSAGATACAAETAGQAHAALVVDTGSRTTTYCVELDAGSVSGLHLIQLAGLQYGLTYRLGFGGQAVCALEGVGPSTGDCFGDYPDFWGYWHGNGSSGWSWAGTGAASASIREGTVEGWSWGAGASGTSHPAPPAQGFDDVCAVASTPTPKPTSTPKPTPTFVPSATPAPTRSGGAGGGSATGSPASSASKSPRSSAHARPSSSKAGTTKSSPIGDIVRAVATSGQIPSTGGPPAGALIAVGAVALLGAGSWLTRRRRLHQERT
jgi:LPXTG-motif cell wall-anchored protein